MTKEEHLLVLTLFTKQAQFIKTLLNILRSRGVITGDDASAFEFATAMDQESNAAIFSQVLQAYVKLAKGLGVETGLENP